MLTKSTNTPKKPPKKVIPKNPNKTTEIDHILKRMLECKPKKRKK